MAYRSRRGMGATGGGQLSFTTSRGGTSLQPGDTWTIKIVGASPNSPVTSSGSMPGATYANTAMGTTDSSGTWIKSGTFSAADAGVWLESYSVGGAPSGSFTFEILPAAAIVNSSGAATDPAKTPATTPATTPSTGFDLAGSFKCVDPTSCWFGFPKWAVIAAAAGAAFLVLGKGKHG